jgi:hypothetical protein
LRLRSCFTVFDGVAPRAIQSFTFAVSTDTCFSSFSMGWYRPISSSTRPSRGVRESITTIL